MEIKYRKNNILFSNGKTTVIPVRFPNFPFHIKNIDGFLILDTMWFEEIYFNGNAFTNIKIYINHIEDLGIPSFEEVDEMINFINNHKKVVISCIGGHGRTGTILAIWCGLNGIKDPIKYVRENYSRYAIETKEQEEFVIKYLRWKNE